MQAYSEVSTLDFRKFFIYDIETKSVYWINEKLQVSFANLQSDVLKREMLKGNIINQYYMAKNNSPPELHSLLSTNAEAVQYTPVKALPFWIYPEKVKDLLNNTRQVMTADSNFMLGSQNSYTVNNDPCNQQAPKAALNYQDSASRGAPMVQVVIQQGKESKKHDQNYGYSYSSSSDDSDEEDRQRWVKVKGGEKRDRSVRRVQIKSEDEDEDIKPRIRPIIRNVNAFNENKKIYPSTCVLL